MRGKRAGFHNFLTWKERSRWKGGGKDQGAATLNRFWIVVSGRKPTVRARITKANYALASKKGEESRQKPSIIDILPRSVGQLRYSLPGVNLVPDPFPLSPSLSLSCSLPGRRENAILRRSPLSKQEDRPRRLLPSRKNEIRGRCPGDHGMQLPWTEGSWKWKGQPIEIEPSAPSSPTLLKCFEKALYRILLV